MSNVPATDSRSLMAVLFTDAVGFSARVAQDEARTLALLKADFEVMNQVCAKHSGRVIKSTGDGLYMAFDSAAMAVDCAMAIQRVFADRPPHYLQHRIGVHLCDVVANGEDLLGNGVNVASRLEGLASPGGICMSQTLYDIVRSRLPVQARNLGEQYLKNLNEPVTVYEIAPMGSQMRRQAAPSSLPAAPIPSTPPSRFPASAAAIVFLGVCVVAGAVFLGNRPAATSPAPSRGLRPGDPGFGPPPGAPGYVPRPGEPGFRPGMGRPGEGRRVPPPGEPGFRPGMPPPQGGRP